MSKADISFFIIMGPAFILWWAWFGRMIYNLIRYGKLWY